MAESSLPPDPYLALGVPKDASAATIKTQYRKLALKFHPDKVQDAAQKELAADQFHKIQTAWEIVGDEARRQRYDAQCRLVQLRKDVMERGGGGPRSPADVRTANFQVPVPSSRGGEYYARGTERTGRVSPAYEERRPSYAAQQDYYDAPPRATSRKEPEYERSSTRPSPRSEKERSKASQREAKESERSSRREKSKRTERDIRRDRDRKQPVYSSVEEASSESDGHQRAGRRMRDEGRARAAYHEQARRQQEEALAGQYADERTRKIFSQQDTARDHIERSTRSSRQRPESTRRPSPVRMNSSKDKVEYITREGRPPVMIRRGSGRPTTSGRDTEKPRRSSTQIFDEPEEIPRPPPFVSSKSSPTDIRIPTESRQRSQSAQVDKDSAAMPKMRRADSMPVETSYARESRRKDSTMPGKSSGLRGEPQQAYPTPEHSPDPQSGRRYHYGQEYADDAQFPTPGGYRTEIREPNISFRSPRYTRSPSPIRETRPRVDRTNSSAYTRPSPDPRTTSTSYIYPDPTRGSGSSGDSPYPGRPTHSRENSSTNRAAHLLYGEIPTTSPRSRRVSPHDKSAASPTSPAFAEGNEKYAEREIRSEDVNKARPGYSSRRRQSSTVKPSYGRSGSSASAIYVK